MAVAEASQFRSFSLWVWIEPPRLGEQKMEGIGGRLQTFLCEREFYFFSPCVKYVFDFLRPPLPSFSGFFALFDVGRRLTVRLPIPSCKAPAVSAHTVSTDKCND